MLLVGVLRRVVRYTGSKCAGPKTAVTEAEGNTIRKARVPSISFESIEVVCVAKHKVVGWFSSSAACSVRVIYVICRCCSSASKLQLGFLVIDIFRFLSISITKEE